MKRAISQRTRRGSPPLPRQRAALRVVQLTLLAMGVSAGQFAYRAWQARANVVSELDGTQPASWSQIVLLAVLALSLLIGAAAMGFRTVRGPRPPDLGD